MAKRNKGIIAYGTEQDREKLDVMSHLSGTTGSIWIIRKIRQAYTEAFGDADPKRIITQRDAARKT